MTWNIAIKCETKPLFLLKTRIRSHDRYIKLALICHRAGEVNQTHALSASQYMSDEEEYTVWYALSSNMNYLTRMLSKGQGKELLNVRYDFV